MALFSRGKKSDDANVANETVDAVEQVAASVDAAETAAAASEPQAPVPNVNVSVSTFQGLGATPASSLGERVQPAQTHVELPRSPANPPENTQSMTGYEDNVLLRETLARLTADATGAELVGVLRNALQGLLYVRIPADAKELVEAGKPVPVGVARNENGESFLLVFSSAKALFDSVNALSDPKAAAGMAQPASAVLKQVVDGEYAGIVLDNDSAPHRAVFPRDLITRALSEGEPSFRIKTLLAQPRTPEMVAGVALALTELPTWVAVGKVEGGSGIAEAHLSNGKRYVQIFSHPVEVAAMGRGEQPAPLTPAKLRKVLEVADHTDGLLIDPAGPTFIVPRDLMIAAFNKAGIEAE